MAKGIHDIKRRITSVQNTKQITKAMELVSSAKLRKSKERVDQTRPYFRTILRSIQDILASSKGIKHPLMEQREVKNTGYIVLTADRGLCGGFNTNINKLVSNDIDNKDKAKLITVGTKGRDFFKRRNFDIKEAFTHISEKPTYTNAASVAKAALELYKNNEVDEIYLAYTEFVSTITYEPKLVKLLPAENLKTEKSEGRPTLIDYEPSPEGVLDYLIPKYIESTVYGAMVESSASEQGARRVAMESATDNAEEVISDLQLEYNRARQAAITQEISEIVGGAEALK